MGAQGLGFGTAGAMDLQSLFLLNILLGNDLNEAALEATLLGPEITFLEDNCFALTGADMGATLDGVPVPRYEAVTAKKGSVLKLGFAKSGVRAYLGFAGGSCAGGADCAAQRRICGNGSAGPELCRKGSGGDGASQRLSEPEGHADDFIGAISRLYDGADAGKLREGLRPDSQRRKEPPGPAGNRSPGKSSAD